MGCAGPVEPSDIDLFSDDERGERARDAVLQHDEEGAVLLILSVRIHEGLLDEAAQREPTPATGAFAVRPRLVVVVPASRSERLHRDARRINGPPAVRRTVYDAVAPRD